MGEEVNNDGRAAPEENKIGLGKIREWFQDAVDKSRDWRKEAKEDYRFVSGKQWKNADKEQLENTLSEAVKHLDSVREFQEELDYREEEEVEVVVNEVKTDEK